MKRTLWVLCVVGTAACVVLVAVAYIAGFRVYRITSGSMEPTLSAGEFILTQRADVESVGVGDVVTVQRDSGSRVVTHRVIGVNTGDAGTQLRLQGDANSFADPGAYDVTTVQRYIRTVFGGTEVHARRTEPAREFGALRGPV